ncbi:hypothetical protein PGT21_003656 [Puccinia graminis f. sp. tritici]|uniref:Uncharacterized protein n=1 Tax=Puccinia graminis f. sp. tritici TaxID=56615 RepID=A0A5B0SAY0_PUCGR|nr:hypothetical protein PGT21_003656 [Puccinia graminis f. sp. tritici]KAA1134303.1 hypothetical protein PGTUg99_034919 [Puccinia graminis f. sp. tritici]
MQPERKLLPSARNQITSVSSSLAIKEGVASLQRERRIAPVLFTKPEARTALQWRL